MLQHPPAATHQFQKIALYLARMCSDNNPPDSRVQLINTGTANVRLLPLHIEVDQIPARLPHDKINHRNDVDRSRGLELSPHVVSAGVNRTAAACFRSQRTLNDRPLCHTGIRAYGAFKQRMLIGLKPVIGEVLPQPLKMLRISLDSAQTNVLDAPAQGGYRASNYPRPKAGAKFHRHILSSRTPHSFEQPDPFYGFGMEV